MPRITFVRKHPCISNQQLDRIKDNRNTGSKHNLLTLPSNSGS
jgi:hypothetical protein